LARRGQVKSISGQTIETVRFSLPGNNIPTSGSFVNAEADFPSRRHFKGVVTTYWDAGQGKELEIKVGESPFKKIRHQHDSQTNAEAAANGEMRKLTRSSVKIKWMCRVSLAW